MLLNSLSDSLSKLSFRNFLLLSLGKLRRLRVLAFLFLGREAAQGFLQRFSSRALQRARADGYFDAVGGISFNND